jgi:hypothetical protein
MSKKAGPKRIDPETFRPVVWRKKGVQIGDDLEFLICKRRVYHGAPVVGGSKKDGTAAEYFTHPMAIQINPVREILTRFKVIAGAWDIDSTARHGISERCAKVALAQAYHGINASVDLVTMDLNIEAKFMDLHFHKNGVRVRNIETAMRWTQWEKDGIAIKERLSVLEGLGHFCTERQLTRFAADHGL